MGSTEGQVEREISSGDQSADPQDARWRHPVAKTLVALALLVVVVVSALVVSDVLRRQRSIEKRDRVLALVQVGMPAEDAVNVLREAGFPVNDFENRTTAGINRFLSVPIDSKPHLLRSIAYSMDMETDGVGPVMSVVLHLDEAGIIERID